MAIGTLYLTFLNGMAGLFIHLTPDIFVAGDIEPGLAGLEIAAGSRVNRAAGVTGNAYGLVPAQIPVCKLFGVLMAGHAHGRFLTGACFLAERDYPFFSAAFFNMYAARSVAGLAP